MAQIKTKILVVDDEPDIRHVTKVFLERRGYSVFTAENAEAALEQFRKESPLLVLLDIKLGDDFGLDVLKEIKKEKPMARVLMLTGSQDEEHIKKAKEFGADGYIAKPFTTDFLDKVVLQKISIMALRAQKQE